MFCCSGLNGSHTLWCRVPWNERHKFIICWRCGRELPIHYALKWTDNGAECLYDCTNVKNHG